MEGKRPNEFTGTDNRDVRARQGKSAQNPPTKLAKAKGVMLGGDKLKQAHGGHLALD